jgi:hypothetical protein
MASGSGADLVTVKDARGQNPGLLEQFRADVMAVGYDPGAEWHCDKCDGDIAPDDICIVRASDIAGSTIGQPVCPDEDCVARGIKIVHPKSAI